MHSRSSLDASESDKTHPIEIRLAELAAERINLTRRLNDIRAATRAVPPEILSEIFILSATPLRLGAVCSLWRGVVWDTPELWTDIECDIMGGNRSAMGNNLYLLRLFFKNARRLKVAIKLLNIDRWGFTDDRAKSLREILAVIAIENRRRIRSLVLESSQVLDPRAWKQAQPFFRDQQFPHLESLHLLGSSVTPLELRNVPRLRHFSLSNAANATLSPKQRYWKHLTTIRLEKANLNHCLSLLRSAPPKLEVFECVDPIISGTAASPVNTIPTIIIPRLTKFEWTGGLGNLQVFLWQGVHLPAIRTFTWNYPSSLTETWVQLQRNFFQSLSTLETLKIQQYHSIRELHTLWGFLEPLGELDLDACKLEKDGINIMDVLTLLDDPSHRNLLPNLRKLRLEVLFGRGINRMLASRRGGPLPTEGVSQWKGGSRLEYAVIYMEDVIYEPGEQDGLRGLVSGGLRLDMIVGDELVVW